MKFNKLTTTLTIITTFLLIGSLTKPVLAREPSQWLNVVQDNGLEQVGKTAYNSRQPQDIRTISANLSNVILGLLGTVFIILMIAGGFIWMSSGGNAGKIEIAKKLMTAGIIGLLIVLASFAITLFVTSRTIYSTTQGFLGPGEPEWPDPSIKTNDYSTPLF